MSTEDNELEHKLLNKESKISFTDSFSEDKKEKILSSFKIREIRQDFENEYTNNQLDLFEETHNCDGINKLQSLYNDHKRLYGSENIAIIVKNNCFYYFNNIKNSIFELPLNKEHKQRMPSDSIFEFKSYNINNFINSDLYKRNKSNINILDLIKSISNEFPKKSYEYDYSKQEYYSKREEPKLFSFIYENLIKDSSLILSKDDLIMIQFMSYIVCFNYYDITLNIDNFIKEYLQQFNKKSINCLSAFNVPEIEKEGRESNISHYLSYNRIKIQSEISDKTNITGKIYKNCFENNESNIFYLLYSFNKIYYEINTKFIFDINYYHKMFRIPENSFYYIKDHNKNINNYNAIKSGISLFKKLNISGRNETAIDKRIHELINVQQDFVFLKNKEHIIDMNKTLNEEFPWMQNVNKEIVENLILNYEFNTNIKLPSIFINGKPGIGKSYYINRLTQLLDVPYIKYSAGGKSEFLDFVGTSSNWSESKPSLMCQLIANHNVLNPLIFIDEIDKSLSNHNGDLQSSLLNLIDKNDAKHYFETYLSHNVDFSHINWIFAINDVSKINQFLLDRAKVIEVSQPNEDHFELIYNNILESYSKENNIEMSRLLEVNISKDKIFNDFKMNYSLRKMKETIYKDISNHYYDKFFNINKKPKFNIV